jgi:D-tyrosyl-tRNA(Tyr) deacylase
LLIGLLQRVTSGWVEVNGQVVGQISRGLVVLLAVEKGDAPAQAERLVERLAGYRVFPDAEGRMNLSVTEIGGELLLVPQFTLAADTDKGMRPSFAAAAAPDQGKALFALVVELAERRLPGKVAMGRFGADMQVSLTNDGPVTFWLQVSSAGVETG